MSTTTSLPRFTPTLALALRVGFAKTAFFSHSRSPPPTSGRGKEKNLPLELLPHRGGG